MGISIYLIKVNVPFFKQTIKQIFYAARVEGKKGWVSACFVLLLSKLTIKDMLSLNTYSSLGKQWEFSS